MAIHLDLTELAVTGMLALRFSVLVAVLPFLGHRTVPVVWRLGLAVVVAMAVAPVVMPAAYPAAQGLGWPGLVAAAARSLLVGALLALAVNIPFTAVRYAGQVMGIQIGFAIVNTIDPQSGTQVSVLGQLYYLLGVMIFFAVDAHHVVLAAMVQSCTLLPLFGPLDGSAGSWLMLREFGTVFRIGLQVAAPCILVLLLVSATMGVIVKTVPQINVLVVGFPLRIAVGLLTLGLSLTFFREIFLASLQGLESRFGRLLAALG